MDGVSVLGVLLLSFPMVEGAFYIDNFVCDGGITVVNDLLISPAVVEITRFGAVHWRILDQENCTRLSIA